MAIMEDPWYLPEEGLSYRNYPEVNRILPDLDKLISYAQSLEKAMGSYVSATLNRVDIDIAELQKYILLCRAVAETLGKAPSVCYDLLVELRAFQDLMQSLMYIYNRYGSQYIGKPTDIDADPDTI